MALAHGVRTDSHGDNELIAQLCALVEEYKLNYEEAETSLDKLSLQVEKSLRWCEELEVLVHYSNVYCAEMEESLQALDRELARSQATSANKDAELKNLRKVVSKLEANEKLRHDTSDSQSELEFLRKERKRLLEATAVQEKELDDYEAHSKQQQASNLELSLQVKLLESEAANLKRLLKSAAGNGSPREKDRGRERSRHRRQLSNPQEPATEEDEQAIIGAHFVSLSLEVPTDDDRERENNSSSNRGRNSTPTSKAGGKIKDRSPGGQKQNPSSSSSYSPVAQKWSDGKKHRGIYKEIRTRHEGDSDESTDGHRWNLATMGEERMSLAMPPPPPPASGASASAASAASAPAEGKAQRAANDKRGENSKSMPPDDELDQNVISEGSSSKQSATDRHSLARSMYKRAKEALLARRSQFTGRELKEDDFDASDWSAVSASSNQSQSQSGGSMRSRPTKTQLNSSRRRVLPVVET